MYALRRSECSNPDVLPILRMSKNINHHHHLMSQKKCVGEYMHLLVRELQIIFILLTWPHSLLQVISNLSKTFDKTITHQYLRWSRICICCAIKLFMNFQWVGFHWVFVLRDIFSNRWITVMKQTICSSRILN